MLRCQLYMFRTVTVHLQELLFRCCMCRLWYVVRNALPDTSRWYNVWGRTTYHSLHIQHLKEAPEDGPLRSETCRADTWASINNQCCYIVYPVGMYIYLVWVFRNFVAGCTKENPVTYQCMSCAYGEVLCCTQITSVTIATRKGLVFCKASLLGCGVFPVNYYG